MRQRVRGASRSMVAAGGLWLLACMVACVGALAGCSQVEGSDTPPPEFGPLGKPWFGCPEVAAVYLWPPVEGQTFEEDRRPNAAASREIVGVMVYPRGRFGIRMPSRGSPMTALFRERHPNDKSPEPSLADRDWSYAEWGAPEWSCTRGYVDTDETLLKPPTRLYTPSPYPNQDNPRADGRRTTVAWRLTRLADGSLALGMRTHATGGKESVSGWGGQSMGEVSAPDRTTWQWAKLTRVGGE